MRPGPQESQAPEGFLIVEPNAAEELLEWQERDRLIAGQKDKLHHLYRKAEESRIIYLASRYQRFGSLILTSRFIRRRGTRSRMRENRNRTAARAWATRNLIGRIVIGLVLISSTGAVHAADGSEQDRGSSLLPWVIVCLPVVLVTVLVIMMDRKNLKVARNSVKQFDEHRSLVEAHMHRLESQVECLDKRLIRIIELIEAAGGGEGPERRP